MAEWSMQYSWYVLLWQEVDQVSQMWKKLYFEQNLPLDKKQLSLKSFEKLVKCLVQHKMLDTSSFVTNFVSREQGLSCSGRMTPPQQWHALDPTARYLTGCSYEQCATYQAHHRYGRAGGRQGTALLLQAQVAVNRAQLFLFSSKL